MTTADLSAHAMQAAGLLFVPAIGVSIVAHRSKLSRLLWSILWLLIVLWLYCVLFPTWPHDLFGIN